MRMVPPAPTSAALDGLGNGGAHVENRNGQGGPSSRLRHFCVPPNPHSSESMLGRLQREGAGLEELTLHWIGGAGTERSCSMLSSREVGWGLTEAGAPHHTPAGD